MTCHPVTGLKIFFLSFVSVVALTSSATAGFELSGSSKPKAQETQAEFPTENYISAPTVAAAAPIENLSGECGVKKPLTISMDQEPSAPMVEPAAGEMEEMMLAPETPAPSKAPTNLVINYYPLDDIAIHGGAQVRRSIEQAMIEGGGNLRPVSVPGSDGMIGIRAASRSTQYGGMGYEEIDSFDSNETSLTPIPGGEGRKIAGIEQETLPAIAPAPQNQRGGFVEAVGFGRDLPLALALSQVIPPEYSYVFGRNVDAGATVSWQGGKPWNEVLNEMLAPSGMKAVIRNQTILIRATNS